MIKIWIRFVVVSFLMIPSIQQVQGQYLTKHFNTENGLPSNGIKGLQWDESTGFLWIATEAGLVRYNGMNFKKFDAGTNPEFGSSRIIELLKDEQGQITAAGEEGNLSRVNKNTVSFFFEGKWLARSNYNHYCALTASDTLFKKCFRQPWDSLFSVYNSMVLPMTDTACMVFSGGRISYYTVSTQQPLVIPAIPAHLISAFKVEKQVYILDSANQLFTYDESTQQLLRQELRDTAGKPFIIEANNSKLFWQSGSQYPILIQQGKAWTIEKADHQQLRAVLVAADIPENAQIKYAQFIKDGHFLFLGTTSKGLYVITPIQLVTKHPAEINFNQINSFYAQMELPNGNIITNVGRIIGDNPSQDNFGIGNGFLNNIYSINDSLVIFVSSDSMFTYNKFSCKKKLLKVHKIHENFALASSDGKLYIADQNGIGVITEKPAIDYVKLFEGNLANKLSPSDMIEISPGVLAIAGCEGMLLFNLHTKKMDTLLKFPSVCIRSFFQEKEYTLIGTYGAGFFIMKQGKIKAMPMDNRGYLKFTHCFLKDDNGFCWISTNNGLFKAKLSDLLEAFDQGRSQVYYHYFGKEDGMETTEMNGGCKPCAIRMKNRYFSFPTMDGLVWLQPENTSVLLPAGAIYIDQLKVDEHQFPLKENDSFQFPEKTKNIEIFLAVSAWCKKENLYIDYQLNNEPWVKVDMDANDPKISFSNLSYGKYQLHIRKMNGFGLGNFSYNNMNFSIATPYYQQWWFRILLATLLMGLGYLIFKIRLHQYDVKEKRLSAMVAEKTKDLNLKNIELEKNDQIKSRLIAIINHDIITPLKFMHYSGKTIVEKKETISPEQQLQTISEITRTAKDMEMLSSQILNWIIYQNPNERMLKEEFDLHQLIGLIFGVLQFPAKMKHIQLQNEVPPNFVVYQYMEPLRVLIYNLVLNGINFTAQGSVKVEGIIVENQLIIIVTDSGIGMTKEQIENVLSEEKIITSANVNNKKGTGLGYLIIKDLIKMMEGKFSISSVKNKGTTVRVTLIQ